MGRNKMTKSNAILIPPTAYPSVLVLKHFEEIVLSQTPSNTGQLRSRREFQRGFTDGVALKHYGENGTHAGSIDEPQNDQGGLPEPWRILEDTQLGYVSRRFIFPLQKHLRRRAE